MEEDGLKLATVDFRLRTHGRSERLLRSSKTALITPEAESKQFPEEP
jgi:hypothetical protein